MVVKKKILSGIQPTAQLTLGNYLGALKNWVSLQEKYDSTFLIVDLHALTTGIKPHLSQWCYDMAATYLATGIDAQKSTIVLQSHVPSHAALQWILMCFVTTGELSRMTQFKDKAQQASTSLAGLFCYPVLMAADILLYQTDLVPVGADQKQHLELTRDIALRMHQHCKTSLFTIPEPYIPSIGARIMDLQNPLKKMSKSSINPLGSIFLNDPLQSIEKKFKKAVTDSLNVISIADEQPGVKNLLQIQAACLNESLETRASFCKTMTYGQLKILTAEIVIHILRPLQEEKRRIANDPTYLHNVLKKGQEKACTTAQMTLNKVHDALHLVPLMSSNL